MDWTYPDGRIHRHCLPRSDTKIRSIPKMACTAPSPRETTRFRVGIPWDPYVLFLTCQFLSENVLDSVPLPRIHSSPTFTYLRARTWRHRPHFYLFECSYMVVSFSSVARAAITTTNSSSLPSILGRSACCLDTGELVLPPRRGGNKRTESLSSAFWVHLNLK